MTVIRTILISTFIGLSALCAADAMAQDGRAAETDQRIAEAKDRLDLSDEQLDELTPILEESMVAQRRILGSYGIDPENRGVSANRLSLRQARAMRQDMNVVRSDTLTAVDKILDDAQLEEFKRMQEERQAEMRERIRGARS